MNLCMDFAWMFAWIVPSWFRPGFTVFLGDGKIHTRMAFLFFVLFWVLVGRFSCT